MRFSKNKIRSGTFLFCFFFALSTKAQFQGAKPSIDTGVYAKWPTVEAAAISPNGNYVSYRIHFGGLFGGSNSPLIIKSVDGKWKNEYSAGNGWFQFSPDSKYAILSKQKDSLEIFELGTMHLRQISNVVSYKLTKSNWLVYLLKNDEHSLVLENLATGKTWKYNQVTKFTFSDNEGLLTIENKNPQDKNAPSVLNLIDINNTPKLKPIWSGYGLGKIIFDRQEKQIAFEIAGNEPNANFKKVRCYNLASGKINEISDDSSGLKNGTGIVSLNNFSVDGRRIFISLSSKPISSKANYVNLNVWHYKDRQTQIQQLENAEPIKYCAVVFVDSHKILCLQQDNDIPIWISGNDEWVTVDQWNYDNEKGQYSSILLNTITGTRVKIPTRGTVSPGGKFMVSFNYKDQSFTSFEIKTGITRDITRGIATEWLHFEPGYYGVPYPRGRIVGWLNNDEGVLVYDQNDIWLLDMAGNKPAINLTNGYGKKHKILFCLLKDDLLDKPLKGNEELILTAFNSESKDNGFYKIKMGKGGDPKLLTMGPFAYSLKSSEVPDEALFKPIKADNADVYIIHRETAIKSPNYFITKDFKTFKQITDVQPEKKLNWYSTSLHEWTTPDGIRSQGVLYKPENFDPQKKYPVIFYFYSYLSDNLNICLKPEFSDGRLNIPWYVSNGYLVFTPDIHHPDQDKLYEQSLNSITSAAMYLAKLPFVDSTKMAIQGISWGGILTNYFVTHTNMFAAACSASGLGDLFSQYNGIDHGTFSQDLARYSNGSGKSLWDTPQWYINNSPVMSANKVTTPFLMMETPNDGACPFHNAFELYNGLRINEKKVWMLEYTDCDHGLWGESGKDFDLRMRQFFGYYLKGEPAPIWMTRGIPGRLKGIDDGFEYDTSGKNP